MKMQCNLHDSNIIRHNVINRGIKTAECGLPSAGNLHDGLQAQTVLIEHCWIL